MVTGVPLSSSVPLGTSVDLAAQLDAWTSTTLAQALGRAQSSAPPGPSVAPAVPVVDAELLPVIAGGRDGLERTLAGYRQDQLVAVFRAQGDLVAALVRLADGGPVSARPGPVPAGASAWPVLATLGPFVVRIDSDSSMVVPATGLRAMVALSVGSREVPIGVLDMRSGQLLVSVDRDAVAMLSSLLTSATQGAPRSEQAVIDLAFKVAARLVLDAPSTGAPLPAAAAPSSAFKDALASVLARPLESMEPALPREIALVVPLAVAGLASAGPSAFTMADRPAAAFIMLLLGPSLTPPSPLPFESDAPGVRATRPRSCGCSCDPCRLFEHDSCLSGCLPY